MSRVVVVKQIGERLDRLLTESEYESLLSAGLCALAGQNDLKAAVRSLLPDGVIGMKPNCVAHRLNSTSSLLVDALSAILVKTGTREQNIVVWERSNRELTSAGFPPNVSSAGRRCVGTDANVIGYSDEYFGSGDVNSRVSRVLTDIVDANVNMPILKDHSLAGLSGALKNMYGAINNPNKCHGDNCDPYCAHVNNLEPIRAKNRLVVMDAVRVQYDGGPGYSENHLAFFNSVIISTDPAAADRAGLEILEHLRAVNKMPTLSESGRPVKYLASAEKIGVGVADLKKVELQVITVDGNGKIGRGGLRG